jgi:hypothetical protein
VSRPESSKWENQVDLSRCSVEQYLRKDYKSWPGDWEGTSTMSMANWSAMILGICAKVRCMSA